MPSIGVKGYDVAAGVKIVDDLELVSNLANVGHTQSLAIHLWVTTHKL
jgi:O-acetylhomoserine/O-acetylserine sulfhydrylase